MNLYQQNDALFTLFWRSCVAVSLLFTLEMVTINAIPRIMKEDGKGYAYSTLDNKSAAAIFAEIFFWLLIFASLCIAIIWGLQMRNYARTWDGLGVIEGFSVATLNKGIVYTTTGMLLMAVSILLGKANPINNKFLEVSSQYLMVLFAAGLLNLLTLRTNEEGGVAALARRVGTSLSTVPANLSAFFCPRRAITQVAGVERLNAATSATITTPYSAI